jgi:hypothetical protein
VKGPGKNNNELIPRADIRVRNVEGMENLGKIL